MFYPLTLQDTMSLFKEFVKKMEDASSLIDRDQEELERSRAQQQLSPVRTVAPSRHRAREEKFWQSSLAARIRAAAQRHLV